MLRFPIPPQSVPSALRSPHRPKQPRRRGLRFERLEVRAMLSINADFNGDGFDDLAVGAPDEDIGEIASAGAVSIIYGGPKGLSATGNQFWHQNVPGVNGEAESFDKFGFALAGGDFNGDGFDDLAVGALFDDVGGKSATGAVNVLYGSASGLRAGSVDQLWTQDSPGVNDVAEMEDQFGSVLAAGDFNGDGRDDLAIGVPAEGVGTIEGAGMVNVLYGSTSGLTGANDQHWHQNSSGINDAAEPVDLFGYQLAAGDFNGDGRDDLAISVINEAVGNGVNAGAVNVIYGSGSGLTGSGDQFWNQNSSGIPDDAENDDGFSSALAAGDFNGDGRDDLAIGIHGEDFAGACQLLNGSANKLIATTSFFNSSNLGSAAGMFSSFGATLAAGDFDGDGNDDLAIGAPSEKVSGQNSAGAVYVMYGSSTTGPGLTISGAQHWTQDSDGVLGFCQVNDGFGSALTTGDYDGDHRADLAIGIPSDRPLVGFESGAVSILYGFLNGLFADDDQLWHQNQLNSADGTEEGDGIGSALG